MDVDETKKRKVEEEEKPEVLELETVLKAHLESQQNLVKLLALLAQKVVGLEKMFNKDLFKPQ